jgi:formate hydrogenlyase subunit 3/multisubunit Na+/H+ antiporter MnhD subunit
MCFLLLAIVYPPLAAAWVVDVVRSRKTLHRWRIGTLSALLPIVSLLIGMAVNRALDQLHCSDDLHMRCSVFILAAYFGMSLAAIVWAYTDPRSSKMRGFPIAPLVPPQPREEESADSMPLRTSDPR